MSSVTVDEYAGVPHVRDAADVGAKSRETVTIAEAIAYLNPERGEGTVVDDGARGRAVDVRDLVGIAGFLAPELHHTNGVARVAIVITEWADGDAALLGEAETIARREGHAIPAGILHLTRELAA